MLKPTAHASLSISVFKYRLLRQDPFVLILKDLFAGGIGKSAAGRRYTSLPGIARYRKSFLLNAEIPWRYRKVEHNICGVLRLLKNIRSKKKEFWYPVENTKIPDQLRFIRVIPEPLHHFHRKSYLLQSLKTLPFAKAPDISRSYRQNKFRSDQQSLHWRRLDCRW